MNRDDFNHFVCIVAGNEPEKIMAQFAKEEKGDKKILIPITSAPQFRQHYINTYRELIKGDISELEKKAFEAELEFAETSTDLEFFDDKTHEMEHDPETGDVITYENVMGKWRSYNLGKFFSIPFKLKDGKEAYQARKSEIDWDAIHLNNKEVYEAAWDMVIGHKQPATEEEQIIYDNMKNRGAYFLKYGDRDTYVISNTAFWGYAFASDKTGWLELEPEMNQFIWVKNYYDLFIKPLPEDTLLTIYECTK